jgi:hypothetical protein
MTCKKKCNYNGIVKGGKNETHLGFDPKKRSLTEKTE